MNILVFAAHPDDEVLGMGGTISKLAKNHKIHLCVVSEGASAQYTDKKMIKKRKEYCLKSGKILGISNFIFLDYPDMQLDTIPVLDINKNIQTVIDKIKPKIVFTTPKNDLNKDHQIVFDSTLVATRPHKTTVKKILAYEIGGVIQTPFIPNIYIDISKEFTKKIQAFKCYKSEIQKYPYPRSIKAIEIRSLNRGMEAGMKMAESFELIRDSDYF